MKFKANKDRRVSHIFDRRMAENSGAMGAVGQEWHMKWVNNPENENLRNYKIRDRRQS